MSASLVTFANFGKKRNLRTTDMLPIIESLDAHKELSQVICQVNAGFYFPHTYSAYPRVVRYPLRAFEQVTGIGIPRRLVEKIFDLFASVELKRTDVTFTHGGHVFPRTVARARTLGSITADISASAHVAANAQLEREEFSILGISGFEGWYTRLAREASPVDAFNYRILMSEFTKQTYVEAGFPADRIYIAQIDVDTDRFSPGADHDDGVFRVLYVAHTQPLKGLHYLLDAWESLSLPKAELIIVGGFTDMPAVLERRYHERIQADTRITWVPGSDTPEQFLKKASVFAYPSLTEGFGRITLEALSCGLPVITTEHAQGLVEDRKTGFVIPIRDAKALAEKIQYLHDHPDERQAMSLAARRSVETKKPFGDVVYGIYQDIVRRHTSDAKHSL